jgi:hypothetical protein
MTKEAPMTKVEGFPIVTISSSFGRSLVIPHSSFVIPIDLPSTLFDEWRP